MEDSTSKGFFDISRGTVVEGVVGLVVLGLTFAAIAATDVASLGTLFFWNVLVVLVALADIAARRSHGSLALSDFRSLLPILLHWIAVLFVVHLIYLMVGTGRMANADTGLTGGLILALGTFLAGVHGNWRIMVLGGALAVLCAGMAIVEQYLWVLFVVALLAIALLLFGSRLTGRRHAASARSG